MYFDADEDRTTGRLQSNSKLIPDRGAWMEFETRKSDYLTIKFNRSGTIPVTVLLRAMAAITDGMPDAIAPIKTGSTRKSSHCTPRWTAIPIGRTSLTRSRWNRSGTKRSRFRNRL